MNKGTAIIKNRNINGLWSKTLADIAAGPPMNNFISQNYSIPVPESKPNYPNFAVKDILSMDRYVRGKASSLARKIINGFIGNPLANYSARIWGHDYTEEILNIETFDQEYQLEYGKINTSLDNSVKNMKKVIDPLIINWDSRNPQREIMDDQRETNHKEVVYNVLSETFDVTISQRGELENTKTAFSKEEALSMVLKKLEEKKSCNHTGNLDPHFF